MIARGSPFHSEAARRDEVVHPGWRWAAGLAVLAWTALVHARPPGFFLVASAYSTGWLLLSWKAMGSEAPPRLRLAAREVLLGLGLGAVMVAASLGVRWGLCRDASWGLCESVRTLAARAGEVPPWALVSLGLLIAPAEELFWHGALHGVLRPRVGRVASAAVSTVLASLVLYTFGERELALAALPTFLLWGLLAEWRRSLVAACVSHSLWTVLAVWMVFKG